ncbi:hypothetical protein [Cereibacter johrii]|uniref:hypothetical protein n=1 Tax=Cereibacter johrii TaxID=445629 RepID=UPI000DD2D13F|nr:hypothetical protein [Cereibacter johrii]
MKVLGLDAQAADSALRRLAAAGFLEYDQDARRPGWSLTGAGRRLALDPLRPRFGRDKADQIIAAVTARARLINSDPDRLHRVKLRLFGSALDTDRHDFGDVDISVDILPRFLETTERERILDLIKGRTPSSATRTIIGGLFAEHAQDSREIKATLKKGLRNLSLMTDDLMELGVPFRVIVDHDLARDVPLEPPQEIVRPNRKPEEAPPRNLDGVTTILEPRGRIRNPARRVANRDVRLNARDMLEMEADA